jgi:hypothetical protein
LEADCLFKIRMTLDDCLVDSIVNAVSRGMHPRIVIRSPNVFFNRSVSSRLATVLSHQQMKKILFVTSAEEMRGLPLDILYIDARI